MDRDTLYLLAPNFTDPDYPGQVFYCSHCGLMEFVLAQYADQLIELDVVRVAWPRPRLELVNLLGAENQSLPLLIIGKNTPTELATDVFQERHFVRGVDALLQVLSVRYGIPFPHP